MVDFASSFSTVTYDLFSCYSPHNNQCPVIAVASSYERQNCVFFSTLHKIANLFHGQAKLKFTAYV